MAMVQFFTVLSTLGPHTMSCIPRKTQCMKFLATSDSYNTRQKTNLTQFMNYGTCLIHIALPSAIIEPYMPKVAQIKPKSECYLLQME